MYIYLLDKYLNKILIQKSFDFFVENIFIFMYIYLLHKPIT